MQRTCTGVGFILCLSAEGTRGPSRKVVGSRSPGIPVVVTVHGGRLACSCWIRRGGSACASFRAVFLPGKRTSHRSQLNARAAGSSPYSALFARCRSIQCLCAHVPGVGPFSLKTGSSSCLHVQTQHERGFHSVGPENIAGVNLSRLSGVDDLSLALSCEFGYRAHCARSFTGFMVHFRSGADLDVTLSHLQYRQVADVSWLRPRPARTARAKLGVGASRSAIWCV